MVFKLFIKLGAGFEDGTYVFSDNVPQREFVSGSEDQARAFRLRMLGLYPTVVYEVHEVDASGTVVRVLT